MRSHMVSKSVSKEGEKGWSIGHQDHTHMGSTSAQGLEPSSLGWKMEDSAVYSADPGVCTSQLDQSHKFTVGPLKHKWLRTVKHNSAEDNSQPQVLDDSVCQDNGMSQRIADCHVPIKGHGQDKP
ncbi:hypothetical protein FD755_017012 [Muntiacus reevesi]|uniref:Uncharacterized protein n=1 Tax=Muntiacus reevesi TaxID=9886 RepID=A0A5N3X9I6_MUNRE|nr:hypothetical protein FD755_017012 [Muntiacus reevesi]